MSSRDQFQEKPPVAETKIEVQQLNGMPAEFENAAEDLRGIPSVARIEPPVQIAASLSPVAAVSVEDDETLPAEVVAASREFVGQVRAEEAKPNEADEVKDAAEKNYFGTVPATVRQQVLQGFLTSQELARLASVTKEQHTLARTETRYPYGRYVQELLYPISGSYASREPLHLPTAEEEHAALAKEAAFTRLVGARLALTALRAGVVLPEVDADVPAAHEDQIALAAAAVAEAEEFARSLSPIGRLPTTEEEAAIIAKLHGAEDKQQAARRSIQFIAEMRREFIGRIKNKPLLQLCNLSKVTLEQLVALIKQYPQYRLWELVDPFLQPNLAVQRDLAEGLVKFFIKQIALKGPLSLFVHEVIAKIEDPIVRCRLLDFLVPGIFNSFRVIQTEHRGSPEILRCITQVQGSGLIMQFVNAGEVRMLQLLLEHGFSVDRLPFQKHILLEYAASLGRIEVVQWLLANSTLLTFERPLYSAITRGHIEIVRLLLGRVDPNTLTQAGRAGRDSYPPLTLAIEMGWVEIVQLLLERVDLTTLNQTNNSYDSTPLNIALRRAKSFCYLNERENEERERAQRIVELVKEACARAANAGVSSNSSSSPAAVYLAAQGRSGSSVVTVSPGMNGAAYFAHPAAAARASDAPARVIVAAEIHAASSSETEVAGVSQSPR